MKGSFSQKAYLHAIGTDGNDGLDTLSFLSVGAFVNQDLQPSEAVPHHAILLADPQLVDPHTYPGRPWPLSTLTVKHTDLYLRRSYFKLLSVLSPSTLYFLGDLFDGGREWSTGTSQSADKRWKNYDEQYWLGEYDRFGRIFLDGWNYKGISEEHLMSDRKIIASLPGNHDLGFGNGIRLPVRQRFHTFFGNGNRVDVLGNHTFVSVDTVSLSAKGQSSSETGGGTEPVKIWGDTDEFLSNVKTQKLRALNRILRMREGGVEDVAEYHTVIDIDDYSLRHQGPSPNLSMDLPTILLTHVPLYRASGTPCGPLREKWPPSKQGVDSGGLPDKDDANAIRVEAGYQYQNVLQPAISKELVEKVGSVEYVFSGDDHDYCEVIHRGYTSRGGGIREITVKSMSWAMGVRKPGFQMLSLWNPIDQTGHPIPWQTGAGTANINVADTNTLQSHLCHLPDQLGIFIRYAFTLCLTIIGLAIRALLRHYGRFTGEDKNSSSVLPLYSTHSSIHRERKESEESKSGGSSSDVFENHFTNGLAVRSTRTRSASPVTGYGIPMMDRSRDADRYEVKKVRFPSDIKMDYSERALGRHFRGILLVWTEVRQGFFTVAMFALPWYFWLVWTE